MPLVRTLILARGRRPTVPFLAATAVAARSSMSARPLASAREHAYRADARTAWSARAGADCTEGKPLISNARLGADALHETFFTCSFSNTQR
jgi:hypothetical protein